MTLNIDSPPSAPARLPTQPSSLATTPTPVMADSVAKATLKPKATPVIATPIATPKAMPKAALKPNPAPSSSATPPVSADCKCNKRSEGSSAMRLFALLFLLFCFAWTFMGFIPFIGVFFSLISLFFIPIAFIACLAARWAVGIIISFALPLVILFSIQFQMSQISNIFHDIEKYSQQVESSGAIQNIFKISDEQRIMIKKTIGNIHDFKSKMEFIIQGKKSSDENKAKEQKVEKLLPAPAAPAV